MDKRGGKTNLDWFDRYVMNEIPIHLIRLSDMKVVERNDVRKHIRGSKVLSELPAQPSIYAILSHRWLDEGETTYEEMKSGNATGPGYEKLKKFCEKAQAYRVQYAWSDTCCIDKSSSTELDESIRSMFRWYKNSSICIIHLAQSETIADIMDDEWTERGWTLQELLASRTIKLFNKHWMPMTSFGNEKSRKDTEVMKTLSRATGIPLRDLSIFLPGPESVDERMTWAARRKTTRDEDVAYSLMGIFDVSLQIAYGEGADRAFCRLIEAIMQDGDPSVLNWAGEPMRHNSSYNFPRSPRNFAIRTLEFHPDPRLGRLEMTMTSTGLRIPLVILPLRVSSNQEVVDGVGRKLIVECALCPAIKIKFVELLPVLHDSLEQYALGIVTYSLGPSEVPRIPGKSVSFILRRENLLFPSSKVCRPRSRDFIGLESVPPPDHEFDRWESKFPEHTQRLNFSH